MARYNRGNISLITETLVLNDQKYQLFAATDKYGRILDQASIFARRRAADPGMERRRERAVKKFMTKKEMSEKLAVAIKAAKTLSSHYDRKVKWEKGKSVAPEMTEKMATAAIAKAEKGFYSGKVSTAETARKIQKVSPKFWGLISIKSVSEMLAAVKEKATKVAVAIAGMKQLVSKFHKEVARIRYLIVKLLGWADTRVKLTFEDVKEVVAIAAGYGVEISTADVVSVIFGGLR